MTDCLPEQYRRQNIDTVPPTFTCVDCPNLSPELIDSENITDENSLMAYFRRKSGYQSSSLSEKELYGELLINGGQCSNYSEFMVGNDWMIETQNVNSSMDSLSGTWSVLGSPAIATKSAGDLSELCDNPSVDQGPDIIRMCKILDFYKNSEGYLSPSDIDSLLMNQFGTTSELNLTGYGSSVLSALPSEYGGGNSIEDYKREIHKNRGRHIIENPNILSYLNNSRDLFRPGRDGQLGGRDKMFEGNSEDAIFKSPSKDNILAEEIYDFFTEMDENYTKNKDSDNSPNQLDQLNIQSMFSGVGSSVDFEMCMNHLFEDKLHGKYNDNDIQLEISQYTSISQLKSREIDYIEDKLKIISVMEPEQAYNCMGMLNSGETICDKGMSDRMLKMSYLVFHIIGLDKIDLDSIKKGTPEYYNLTRVLDRLTPYIRSALKKIIEISKYYELQTCGFESSSSQIFETIYNDVFEKSSEIDININGLELIPTYLVKDTNIMEFTKTIILMIVMIAGIYVLIMILNRPLHSVSA